VEDVDGEDAAEATSGGGGGGRSDTSGSTSSAAAAAGGAGAAAAATAEEEGEVAAAGRGGSGGATVDGGDIDVGSAGNGGGLGPVAAARGGGCILFVALAVAAAGLAFGAAMAALFGFVADDVRTGRLFATGADEAVADSGSCFACSRTKDTKLEYSTSQRLENTQGTAHRQTMVRMQHNDAHARHAVRQHRVRNVH